MKNLTPEMIEKAKAAKNAEELLALANDNGVEMTAEEAATYFAQLNPTSGELNDDDLDSVAGGACGNSDNSNAVKLGDTVNIISGAVCTCGSTIGIVSKGQRSVYIECKQCSKKICNLDDCTYEKIG
jgi:predicted ribosomally synthesized peptide with nif11-like leader